MSLFDSGFSGRHVTIVSSAVAGGLEHADTGTIVAIDGNWVELAKDNGEMLLFPFTSIRVIKILDSDPAHKKPAGVDVLGEPVPPIGIPTEVVG